MIYLDYAATTPMSDKAIDVYGQVARSYYGNPISLHDIGTAAAQLLETSREQLAQLISGEPAGIYFTGGGSEANELALESLIDGQSMNGYHLITTEIEHSSIHHFFEKKEAEGFEVTYLPVDGDGMVDPETVREAIKETTILASIHYGNGEIGTIQPVQEIGRILREAGVIFHSDCCQTFGKIPLDLSGLSIDSISISSPKVYGPKGVGAVYISPSVRWQPRYSGTTHESGFRAGTVNVPGVCAFVTSVKEVINDMMEETARLHGLRAAFLESLAEVPFTVSVEGHPHAHLPHVIALRPKGIEGQFAMLEMNRLGFAISTGSACLVGQSAPPRVMKALGLSDMEAKEFIRLSTGRGTTEAHMKQAAIALGEVLAEFFAKIRQ